MEATTTTPAPLLDVSSANGHAQATSAAIGEAEYRKLLAELEELRQSKTDLERLRNVDANLARFTDLMRWQVDYTLQGWSEQLLDALAPFLDAINAAFYLLEEEPVKQLRLIGGYALPAGTLDVIGLGEGLTGQVARTARYLVLDDPKTFRAATDTSLARIDAAAFVIYPLIHDNRVEGVLEVSLLQVPSTEQLDFLRQLTQGIAGNLGSIRAQVQIRRLLAEAQQKGEALASQEEEMRQNMEELEATQEEMRRVQQEIELRQAEFQRMANAVPGMILQFRLAPDGSTSFLYVSEGSWDVLGLDPAALIADGTLLIRMTDPEHMLTFRDGLRASARNLQPFYWSGRLTLADGSHMWAKSQAVPRKTEDGSVLWDGILTDITQEKEAERRLQDQQAQLTAQEEEMRQNLEELEATQEEMRKAQAELERQQLYMRSIIDSADASVSMYDSHYRYLAVNKTILDRYATSGIKIELGQNAFDTFDKSIHAEWKGYYDRALSGESFKLIKTRQDEDRVRHIEYDFRPISSDQGNLFVLFSRDVTRYIELENNANQQDEMMARYVKFAPIVMYQHSADLATKTQRFTYVSPNVREIIGMDAGMFLAMDNKEFAAHVHAEDQQLFLENYMSAVKKDTLFDVTVRLRNPATNTYQSVRIMSSIRRPDKDTVLSDGVIMPLHTAPTA